MTSLPVFWLAYTFGMHIAMVNIGIGLAVLVPYLKYRATRSGNEHLLEFSHKLMRFYAATYGVAGVFATAFTVFLLSFYPQFLGLAGNITLIPFGISIIMIIVHFFSIATYYYGWDRWSEPVHNALGVLLAISALLIPLGFRSVFAFLNIPKGLYFDGLTPRLSLSQALTNPTLPPLYLKSIVAAITTGLIIVGGYAAVSYYRSSDEKYRATMKEVIERSVPWALVGLIIMFFLGLWYALSLRAIPYKFNNIFAPLGWKVRNGTAVVNVAWLFVLKMILYVAQVYIVLKAFNALRKTGFLTESEASNLLFAGVLAIVTIVLGEFLNAFSQYPYFIAGATLPQVIKAIPPQILPQIAAAINLQNPNVLATLKSVQAITTAFMIFLTASLVYFFYVFFKKEE
jgi:cytochrome d ubiquinol oxidase subunit I